MLQKIKELADKAIALQNKDAMDAALREIIGICHHADIVGTIWMKTAERAINSEQESCRPQTLQEAQAMNDAPHEPAGEKVGNIVPVRIDGGVHVDLNEASFSAMVDDMVASNKLIALNPNVARIDMPINVGKKGGAK